MYGVCVCVCVCVCGGGGGGGGVWGMSDFTGCNTDVTEKTLTRILILILTLILTLTDPDPDPTPERLVKRSLSYYYRFDLAERMHVTHFVLQKLHGAWRGGWWLVVGGWVGLGWVGLGSAFGFGLGLGLCVYEGWWGYMSVYVCMYVYGGGGMYSRACVCAP